jgi:glycosyltransferase involved in cell wall biosynthesis
VFVGHERGEGAVGLCSAYYERKAPGTVVELVRAMPHRRFRLLGPGWRGTPEFAALEMMPNFEYSELPYEQYPSWYRGIDVFLSPSDLEGGPIPLLEAMMANAVPVATRTGIAPDVIRHGENGFLCEPGVAAPDLAALVDRAYDLAGPVRPTVEHLTWDRFAQMTPVLGRVTAP